MVTQRERSARKRTKKRSYERRGSDLVRLAAELSGTSASMVYAVLNERAVSAPVSRAIEEARLQLERPRRRVA
jgi:hypothetical protein